jgi:hypothetical protein
MTKVKMVNRLEKMQLEAAALERKLKGLNELENLLRSFEAEGLTREDILEGVREAM